jgi:hypothetical protein
LRPLPAGVIATLNPEDEKYQMYIQMAEREDTLGYDRDTEYRLKLLSAELLDAAQNHKWSEAEVLQLDVDELTAHVKETYTRVDEAMNILKESNLCPVP